MAYYLKVSKRSKYCKGQQMLRKINKIESTFSLKQNKRITYTQVIYGNNLCLKIINFSTREKYFRK